MTKIDYYKGLNEDSKLTIELSIETVAKEICAMNYGAHRLLSAMVHELRRKNTAYILAQVAKDALRPPENRLEWTDEDHKSPLADTIEAALNQGHTH